MGFNPRAHAGRDRGEQGTDMPLNRFNPRAHAGRDIKAKQSVVVVLKFQSTRPRGARL